MKKNIIILFLVLMAQLASASGHFVYLIREDGVYGGAYGQVTKIEGADPKTFEFIDASPSPWGLVVTYAKDKNRVYYYTDVIAGADPQSFKVINSWYAIDKNHVYDANNGHKIFEDYDVATFEILGNWFVKDKQGVYYEHNISSEAIKIENVDAPSFEILWGTNYMKDKNSVLYYQEGDGNLTVKPLEDADPNTFVVDIPSSPYARDATNLYRNSEKLADADPNTFKLIMRTPYGTDGKNVYYESTKLKDADAPKFKLVNALIGVTDRYVYFNGKKLEGIHPDNFTFGSKSYPYYVKNDSIVYFQHVRIKGADAATFEVIIGWGDKAKDKNHTYKGAKIDDEDPILYGIHPSGVYFMNDGNQQLQDADPRTFKILSKSYGKDKKTVYWINYKVADADTNTFEIITSSVGKDKNTVYYGRDKIAGADIKTYTPLNGWYGKDDKNVFFEEKTINNVDLLSFKVIENVYAKDKNHVYFKDVMIENSDPKSFQKIDYFFSKDKNNIYYEDKAIVNADPVSFEVFKESYKDYSKDKNHVYFKTSIIEDADPATFERYLGTSFWIDKNYVYFQGKKFEDSDASTFEILGGSHYRDKNNIYYNYQKIDVDRASFKIISKYYTMDKDHVYMHGKIDDRYDVKTFTVKDIYP